MPEGGLAMPTTDTPWWCTTSPASVSSQLPPWSAAMSTTTAPSAMPSTIEVETSTGALRPGTAAVVMTTSERPTSSASAGALALEFFGRELAGVAAGSLGRHAEVEERRAQALRLLLGRGPHVVGLDHRAQAPRRRDGCRPATPTPITSTLAGGTVPAAVMNMGKNLARCSAALRPAR